MGSPDAPNERGKVLRAHALHELRERDTSDRRRERRRVEARWAITTLVALASLAAAMLFWVSGGTRGPVLGQAEGSS